MAEMPASTAFDGHDKEVVISYHVFCNFFLTDACDV